MINCEHVIVQRVVLLFFPVKFQQTIPNKTNQDCRNYVRNISGTFQETRNMSKEKSTMRQGLVCAEILPLQVLLPSPPEK